MKNSALKPSGVAALLLCSSLAFTPALASSVEINIFQGKAIQTIDTTGKKTEKIVPADVVVPGDIVVYRYIVNNQGTQNAEGVVVNTAVDSNMRYVRGSATKHGVLFSADGGTVYEKEENLKVMDVDGTMRDANSDDVTNIRWVLNSAVMPDRPISVGFRAVLK